MPVNYRPKAKSKQAKHDASTNPLKQPYELEGLSQHRLSQAVISKKRKLTPASMQKMSSMDGRMLERVPQQSPSQMSINLESLPKAKKLTAHQIVPQSQLSKEGDPYSWKYYYKKSKAVKIEQNEVQSPGGVPSHRSNPTSLPEIEKVTNSSDIGSNIVIQNWGNGRKRKLRPIDSGALIEKAKLWEQRALEK